MCFIKTRTMQNSSSTNLSSLAFPSIPAGLSLQYVDINSAYSCDGCCEQYFDPLQLSCGHRICSCCFEKLKKLHPKKFKCPTSDPECEDTVVDEVRPDYSVRRELAKRCVYCPNRNLGCLKQPQYKSLTKHLNEECEFAIVECPNGCGLTVIAKTKLQSHLDVCPKRPKRCSFFTVGCTFQSDDDNLSEHLKNNSTYHLEKVACKVTGVDLLNVKLTGKVEQIGNRCSDVSDSVRAIEADVHELKSELLSLHSDARKIMMEITQKKQLLDDVAPEWVGDGQKMDTLEKDIKNTVEQHKETLTKQVKNLQDLDLKLQCLETTNYSGVLVWKINDFKKRKSDAKNGKTLSLYSQPFYTSRYGYKMCARVYLNGDGAGKNEYISFFFVIMKGDYDDILTWPFKQKVTLMLLDQKTLTKDIIETFRPDQTSSSFKKPTSLMNIASGSPKFVAHQELDRSDVYLKNDIIFFKIIVDVADL